jgi:hypothetical protein
VKEENDDPLQKILPKVKFNCKGKPEGYYADNDFCELFHYCKVIMTLLDILLFNLIFKPTFDSKTLFNRQMDLDSRLSVRQRPIITTN